MVTLAANLCGIIVGEGGRKGTYGPAMAWTFLGTFLNLDCRTLGPEAAPQLVAACPAGIAGAGQWRRQRRE